MEGRIKLGKRLCAWLLSFALVLGLAPGMVIRAAAENTETIVWEGSEAISWNSDITGTQYEANASLFTGLEKDDVIKIYTQLTEGNYGAPQYVVTYKKGDGWEWTDLTTTVSDGVISFTVENETIATEIAERGLVFRGQAWTATKITITKPAAEPSEQDDPTPEPSGQEEPAASTGVKWTFDSGNEGWHQKDGGGESVWSNGTIASTISVRAGEWNESVAAYLANGSGIATKGGNVTFDIIYKASDKETLEQLSTRVVYKYGQDWTYVAANAQPLVAGNALSENEYYYQMQESTMAPLSNRAMGKTSETASCRLS